MMKFKARSLGFIAVLAVLMIMGAQLALCDKTVTINVFSSETFQNTGYKLKSYMVDVSSISTAAKQVVIHITGQANGDPYLRYLIIKVDGQIVNMRPGPSRWGGHTALVRNAFDLRYDITSLVKGKKTINIEVGITTFTGSWTISCELQAVIEEQTVIPTPTPTPSNGGMAVKTSWLAAGGGLICIAAAWYLRSKELE